MTELQPCIQYKIFTCTSIHSIDTFSKQIEQKLQLGWKLQGSLSVCMLGSSLPIFCQPMVYRGRIPQRKLLEKIHLYFKNTTGTPECDGNTLNDDELVAQIFHHPALQNFQELLDS